MANLKFNLEDGLQINGAVHKEVELRELTVGDMMDAEAEVEELVIAEDGKPVYKVSPSKFAHEILRRSIVKLGELPMPLSKAEYRLLSRTDLIIMQQHAEKIDNLMVEKVTARGRANTAASAGLQTA
ncbi:MAG: phage tail assembly protein [Alphaproteobacteria bacterium]|nr:phage tail assembly protein [Alphaproteobacteria bacterium]